LLSVGNVGMKMNRRLVPTRWSITATDDMLGKNVIKELQDFQESNYELYFEGYNGNYYLIALFPGPFRYELFEMMIMDPEKRYSTDFEDVFGRKEYASSTVGGYYSVRLAVAEKLKQMKRKASVLVLRFITDEYTAPLGVWVTREAARKSLASRPLEFSSKELLLDYVKKFSIIKFNYNVDKQLSKSKLLSSTINQKRILDY